MAGILFLSILVIIPSCKKEIYTDADALAAMKDGLKYKNDLAKELATLELTNQLQMINLQSQLSIKATLVGDSLSRIGAKTNVNVQVQDVTGSTADMSGFSVTLNQNGTAKTLTTDANGLVVFPDYLTGSAAIVVSKTGFARASGIVNITNAYYDLITKQQAVLVPIFPTDAATAKISGTLQAQLDMTTADPEVVQNGIVSLNFSNVNNILANPNSTTTALQLYGLVGVVYDGGFMQTVKTGADGKYEFKIPKTKSNISYQLAVSTIQKEQKLLFGDYPYKLDSISVDTMKTWFGYYANTINPIYDTKYLTFNYNYGTQQQFAGVNIKIGAPAGGQTPSEPADISWAHNDSTVITWSFTKFANYYNEYTNITQAPVFVYTPYDKTKVTEITPTKGTANITNGKLVSLYMTDGGVYKEFGRKFAGSNIAPSQAQDPVFKFFEQLSDEDQVNWATKITYQTAIAKATLGLNASGKVTITFDLTTAPARKGGGYTAIPNVSVKFSTPHTTDTIINQSSLKVNLLTGGSLSIDPIVLPKYTSTTGFVMTATTAVTISTSMYNGNWQLESSYTPLSASASLTYKVDLLNGFKITDGGLGYKNAPTVRVQNYATKQGTTGGWVLQTVAEATTTLDAQGRIISVSDPVMLDNFMIQYSSSWNGTFWQYPFNNNNIVTVPVDVTGTVQAYARAIVDQFGTITTVLLFNEDIANNNEWLTSAYGASYVSGKGYVTTPNVIVTPVGKTSVAIPAQLKAVVNPAGRIGNIIIVNGGKGYDVMNHPNAIIVPGNLKNSISTNGVSDIQYDINLGFGYRGNPISIF